MQANTTNKPLFCITEGQYNKLTKEQKQYFEEIYELKISKEIKIYGEQ